MVCQEYTVDVWFVGLVNLAIIVIFANPVNFVITVSLVNPVDIAIIVSIASFVIFVPCANVVDTRERGTEKVLSLRAS